MYHVPGGLPVFILMVLLNGPSASAQLLATDRVASGLSRPVFATAPPGDTDRLFIVEQHTGQIKILDLQAETLKPEPFLDIDGITTGNEQGLLGLAFHPRYDENGYFYVNFTDGTGTSGGGTTKIVRYQVFENDADRANPASAQLILSYAQPYSNHNAGWMGFNPQMGPEDPQYLYIASGDGGSGGDPQNRAQTLSSKLGKILRIDVDGSNRGMYGIPDSNPFYEGAGDTDPADDEVWNYGLRNPWRDSFDRQTGDLWLGDVGQSAREEIDFQPAGSSGGENYGWRVKEGTELTGLSGGSPPFVDPVHEYDNNSDGIAVVGGYVYRGTDIPWLPGTYLFGDYAGRFGSGGARVWSFQYENGVKSDFTERSDELAPSVGRFTRLTSFAEDARGELYLLDQAGDIFRIIAATLPGDMNCNGRVDFDDVEAFVLALRDADLYEATYGVPPTAKGDLDGDGDLDFDEIDQFVGLLTGEAGQGSDALRAVPEPAAVWLVVGAVMAGFSAGGMRLTARTISRQGQE